jgi:hypothetical protein
LKQLNVKGIRGFTTLFILSSPTDKMPRPLPDPISEVLTEERNDYTETTLRVYRAAWRDVLGWLSSARPGVLEQFPDSLPPGEVVSEYLRDRSDMAWSTLASRRQALRLGYDELRARDPFGHPEAKRVWDNILEKKREQPSEPTKHRLDQREQGLASIIEEGPKFLRAHLQKISGKQKRDLRYLAKQILSPERLTSKQRELIPEATYDLQVLRNRALLLLVGTADLTRSEVTGIDLEDVYPPEEEGGSEEEGGPEAEGLEEEGPTRIIVYDRLGTPSCALVLEAASDLRYCPHRALAAWILAADLTAGPLFRSLTPHGEITEKRLRPQTINHIIKRHAREAGLDPELSMRDLRG